jgi:hypothetical protein
MLEQQPTFMARKNPGTGWGIDILWPDGETEVVKGFVTEGDAIKWIKGTVFGDGASSFKATSPPDRLLDALAAIPIAVGSPPDVGLP